MKLLAALVVGLSIAACVDTRDRTGVSAPNAHDAGACEDRDKDGFGEGCTRGGDCNDLDPNIHVGCAQCATPAQGCLCDESSKPVSCFRTASMTEDGTVMCHEGTRYCRSGKWSACESIVDYPRPDAVDTQELIKPGAPQQCNDCSVNCFVVRDNLDPVDAGLDATSSNVSTPPGGGLTLTYTLPDAGPPPDAGPVFDPSKCVLGTAPDHDCDGIPDIYDPYPNDKPFATANPTLFLDIAPGETGTGVVNLTFYLNSADVYFLIDQTGSMEGERARLQADLVTGDFINDSTYQCADYDFDRVPNNELKSQGIIGAVRCKIRDANFGVGYFREIPLYYGSADSVTFRNLQDVTNNINSVVTAVNSLFTVGNNDWPEASMLALNALVTGNGYYFGTNRTGLASRSNCPNLTWGYPCFRQSAIPIVVMFTDAQFHQGPTNNAYPYSSSNLGITKGTTSTYTSVTNTNETYANAYDLGDLSNSFYSYIGSTSSMVSDFGASAITCGSGDNTAPDALFKFTLSSTKTLKATTEGSDFDTTLSILRGAPGTQTSLPSYPNTNDTGATAYSFGDISNKWVQASGSSTGLVADYSPNDVSCSAAPRSKDATFTINLSQATHVALDTSGSAYTTSLALFSGTPVATTYTAVANTNDAFDSAYAIGALDGQNKGFSGDTSAAGITASFTAAQLGCSSAPADSATDAVYSFTLANAARVRVSTEDSTLNSVIALTNAGANYVTSTAVTGNDVEASATNVGQLDGKSFTYTGNTTSLNANYTGTLIGCGSGDSAKDAVYKFTLANTQNVQIDTVGSSLDTVLSLFRGSVTSGLTTATVTNTNETGATAYNLGTLNGKSYVTSGSSTSSMGWDYSGTQVSCSSSTTSPDAVYKFHLDTPTRVRMDTTGSSFDTVLSLHNSPMPDTTATTLSSNTNEAVASAYTVNPTSSAPYLSFDGTTNAMTADVPVNDGGTCSGNSAAKDAVYKLNITTAGNYEINTVGSGFDTVLGLYPSTVYNPTPPTVSAQGTAGEQKSSAINVGSMNGAWLSYSGNTSTMASNNSFNSCSASSSSKDVYYSFSVTGTRTVVIDTLGSGYDTVLALYTNADAFVDCNNDYSGVTSQITATLNTGTYYVFIKGQKSTSSGAYTITFRDTTVSTVTNLLSCDDNSGGGTVSLISASLGVGTYYAVVKGKASGDKGNYRFSVKYLDVINSANRITCNNDYSGTTSRIDQDLGAGDYYVVVKGTSSTAKGNYTLLVQDLTQMPGYLTCNDDYTGTTSQITASLPAGTYYVVVKGWSTNNGAYTLNVKDTAFTPTSTYACDYNSGAGGTSLIESNLAAGTYRVIVKGKTATDKGAYKLIVRDVTNVPTQRIACDHNSGTGGASHVEADLTAGTYTVVLKGDTTAGAGSYKLSVRDASNIAATDTSVACDNDSGYSATSSISTSLGAGTYFALVKGYRGTNKGVYQLNIGAGSTSSGTFVPPTYTQTLTATQAKSVKVISVLSCHDDPAHGDIQGDCVATRSQAQSLATSTNALGSNLNPLVFDIDGDGTGLSKTVVDGIGALAKYLEMNVSVRVVFDPDPNPGFGLTVRAVDQAGDGCSGLVGDEHQRCAPGATPRFELAFNNPINAPVPLNPKDPNGGYNFRAELIGNQQFVVDKVPIYIIPRDVNMVMQPVPKVTASGTYWQSISSPGCTGTQRPDWHDLTWNAAVPNGTTVSFGVCASDKSTDLTTCTPVPLCTVTGGGACTTDADCTNGYCSAEHNCQTITAGACSMDKDCSVGARCLNSKCTFSGQPVYIGGVLGTANYTTNLRMQIGLTGNTTANTAPTVHDWSMTYVCNQSI